MINVSNEFKEAIQKNRVFLCKASVQLKNGNTLEITNENLMSDGWQFTDSSASSGSFDIGAAIINTFTARIDNTDESFSTYDLSGARVTPSIGLQLAENRVEWICRGIYVVDTAQTSGNVITVKAYDNMSKFDRAYDSNLVYPATLGEILQDCCLKCGVSLATSTFPMSSFRADNKPESDAVTYRDVVCAVAEINGSFARCNTQGALELRWYDTSTFESEEGLDGGKFDQTTASSYQSGDSADGGNFVNYSDAVTYDGGSFKALKKYHHIYTLSSQDICTDDVVITGICVKNENTEYLSGNEGYVLEISENPLISESETQTVANYLYGKIGGMRFRPLKVSCLSDPSVEAGDPAYVTDRKGNSYPCYLTNVRYVIGGYMQVSCDAKTPESNKAKQYSEATKAIVAARKSTEKQLGSYDVAVQNMTSILSNSMGLFDTVETTENGGRIIYQHNKPTMEESNIIWMKSEAGFMVSTDGGNTWNAGMDAQGNAVLNVLSAIGINADWIVVGSLSANRIHGGTLTLGGASNNDGSLHIVNASGNTIGTWDNAGINASAGSIGGWVIRSDALYNGIPYQGQKNTNSTGMGTYGGGWAFWAGDGRFSVTQAGKLYASDAEITGTITANSGVFNSVTVNGSQINNTDWHVGTLYDGYVQDSTLQNTITNTGTISGGTYSSGTLSGGTGGTYVGTCSGSNLRSCSLNGTSLSFGKGTTYVNADSDNVSWIYGNEMAYMRTSHGWVMTGSSGGTTTSGDLTVSGNLFVGGSSKNRVVETEHYGKRCLSAYETPLPTFSDYGTGTLDENGECYIVLDPILGEAVNPNYAPTVFLTKYGEGDIWVSLNDLKHDLVLAKGTPGLPFAWEMRYVQKGCYDERMAEMEIVRTKQSDMDYESEAHIEQKSNSIDYELEAEEYLNTLPFSSPDYENEGYQYYTKFERSLIP